MLPEMLNRASCPGVAAGGCLQVHKQPLSATSRRGAEPPRAALGPRKSPFLRRTKAEEGGGPSQRKEKVGLGK